jgi:hypothetical protein
MIKTKIKDNVMLLTNKEKMFEKIKEYKNYVEVNAYLTNLIEPLLMEWQGKQMNKRFTDKLKLFIGNEYNVYLSVSNYSDVITLVIRRGTKSIELRVASKKNRKFDMEKYKKDNEYLINQNENYQKYLNAEKHIDEWTTEYEKIQQNIKDLKKRMEEYSCQYIIDWSELRYI